MPKIMKQSAIRTIVVCLTADNISEHEIDTNVFDDPFAEAATRAAEIGRKTKGAIIRSVTQCWEKKSPKKIYFYNSYKILLNASSFKKAEQLRQKIILQHKIDLAKEPLHASPPRDTK